MNDSAAVHADGGLVGAKAFSYDELDIRDVQALDPLNADEVYRALPAMNQRADLAALVAALRGLVPSLDDVAAFSPLECLAAMRDLGMLLGSIKRHGVEPLSVVGEVEPVLLVLGARTEMVPRDTVHHYIVWNPEGARERTYMGDPMEVKLMSSVRLSLPRLGVAVRLCERLVNMEFTDPQFAPLMSELAECLTVMETAIDIVLKHVSPIFFAQKLRPYFEDVRVGGRSYLGPAAAHVPLSLVDLALWASDNSNKGYEHFWRESAEFSLPAWRGYYELWHRRPSFASRLVGALEALGGGPVPAPLRLATRAVARALRALVVFRGRHMRIAREAYAEDVRLYELGSGGGSIGLLSDVLLLTRQNANMIQVKGPPPSVPRQRVAAESSV